MKSYYKYAFFLFIILIILLWLTGIFKSKIKSGEVTTPPKRVSGLKAKEVEVKEMAEIAYVGTIEAEEEAQIATPLSGIITSIKVKEGDCVPRGALLLTIEGESIFAQKEAISYQIKGAEAELKATQAQLEAIRRTYERYSHLLKEGAITPQEFDEIKAKYESAKSSVDRARAQIISLEQQRKAIGTQVKYLNLRAPFSGCIKEKKINLGDLALSGHPLLVLEKAPYKLKVDLPGKYFSEVKIRDEYKVGLEGFKQTFKAKVVEKSSGLDPQTQTFTVKLSLPAVHALKSGSIAKLFIPEKRKVLYIPSTAILKRYDFNGVFVVKPDKTLELRYVKLGEERDGRVEVLSGLKEGELVIVDGIEKACNGCLLE